MSQHPLPYGLPGNAPMHRYERIEAIGWLPHGYLAGGTLANDGTDATNDISIAPLTCRSAVNIVDGGTPSAIDTDQIDIRIPVSIIKQLDVSWAPENYDPDGYSGGGRSGMLDPLASISNATWHIYAVAGGDNQPDIMAIASATQATVLASISAAGFTAYRRIGSIIRASGAILAFSQLGNEFLLNAPVLSSSTALTATASLVTMNVPTGIKVKAVLNLYATDAATTAFVYVSSPDVSDQAPSTTASPGITIGGVGTTPSLVAGDIAKRTNTSAQLRFRAAATLDTTIIVTLGWIDERTV